MLEGSLWFIAAVLPQGLDVLHLLMEETKSLFYQDIFLDNVRPSVCQLNLSRSWVMRQDNDAKRRNKSTTKDNAPSGVVLTSTVLRCFGIKREYG